MWSKWIWCHTVLYKSNRTTGCGYSLCLSVNVSTLLDSTPLKHFLLSSYMFNTYTRGMQCIFGEWSIFRMFHTYLGQSVLMASYNVASGSLSYEPGDEAAEHCAIEWRVIKLLKKINMHSQKWMDYSLLSFLLVLLDSNVNTSCCKFSTHKLNVMWVCYLT